VSRGGARVVVEDTVQSGEDCLVRIGGPEAESRPIRVVWVREAAGGQIVGLQFLDADGTIPPMDAPDDP